MSSFDETRHPRRTDGKFAPKPGGAAGEPSGLDLARPAAESADVDAARRERIRALVDELNDYSGDNEWQEVIRVNDLYDDEATDSIDIGTNDRFTVSDGSVICYNHQAGRWEVQSPEDDVWQARLTGLNRPEPDGSFDTVTIFRNGHEVDAVAVESGTDQDAYDKAVADLGYPGVDWPDA